MNSFAKINNNHHKTMDFNNINTDPNALTP